MPAAASLLLHAGLAAAIVLGPGQETVRTPVIIAELIEPEAQPVPPPIAPDRRPMRPPPDLVTLHREGRPATRPPRTLSRAIKAWAPDVTVVPDGFRVVWHEERSRRDHRATYYRGGGGSMTKWWSGTLAAVGALALAGLSGPVALNGPVPALAQQSHDHSGPATPAPAKPAAGGKRGVTISMDELHRAGGVPPGWRFSWPDGDARKGREVFAKLECYQYKGFHYGADVTLPAKTRKITVAIGKPALTLMPAVAKRFARGAEVSFDWGK